jgi:hypothetical protein
VRRLEDEGSHAEGGSGGTSNVHGGSGAGEVGGLGGGSTNTGARGHTLGLGGNGAVVVRSSGSSDNRGSRGGRSGSSALKRGDGARAVLNGLVSFISIRIASQSRLQVTYEGGGSSHGDGVGASGDNGSGRAESGQARRRSQ